MTADEYREWQRTHGVKELQRLTNEQKAAAAYERYCNFAKMVGAKVLNREGYDRSAHLAQTWLEASD
jgi:hypothetical protein